jgi:hypothetical protein
MSQRTGGSQPKEGVQSEASSIIHRLREEGE